MKEPKHTSGNKIRVWFRSFIPLVYMNARQESQPSGAVYCETEGSGKRKGGEEEEEECADAPDYSNLGAKRG